MSEAATTHRQERALRSNGLHVPFGKSRRDDRMYAPREVPIGKNCDCVCPGCGGTLYSKHCLGERIAPHFAHAPGVDCSTGRETAIHLAAKQLIADERRLYLPELEAVAEARDSAGHLHRLAEQILPGGMRLFDGVRVEQASTGFIPDVTVNVKGGALLFVEIAVTHFVDSEKLAKVKASGVPLLEVDLSALQTVSFEILRDILFTERATVRWLFHPDHEVVCARLAGNVKATVSKSNRQHAAALAEATALARRKEQIEHKARVARKRQKEEVRVRAARFKEFPEYRKARAICHSLQVGELPSSLRAATRVIQAFCVDDPLVWQATLFAGLVHGCVAKGRCWVVKDYTLNWMRDRFYCTTDGRGHEYMAVGDYLAALVKKRALAPEENGRFRIAVTDLKAFETLQSYRGNGVTEDCGLVWASESSWTAPAVARNIALGYHDAYRLPDGWEDLSALPIASRAHPVRHVINEYAPFFLRRSEIVEFLICAGFLRPENTE